MKLMGFQKSDFDNLKKVIKVNKNHYDNSIKNYYDSKRWKKEAEELNNSVYIKIKSLCQFIKMDNRFSNYEIGVCRNKVPPGKSRYGNYRGNLWIWMVDKKKLSKLKSKKVEEAKLHLPQVQIGIHVNSFTTAEIWFDKKSFEERKLLYKYLKENNIDEDKKVNLLIKSAKNNDSISGKGSANNFKKFKEKLNDELYEKASINISYGTDFVENNISEFLDTIKKDLDYIITNYYEPAFGKIIKSTSHGHQRSIDPIKRKQIELIAYEETTKDFQKNGYNVKDVTKDNQGWDLEAECDEEIKLIEVKGLSGNMINVELTPNEYSESKKRKNYILAIVINCLTNPKLHLFYKITKGWQDQFGNILKIDERTGAKMRVE